MRSPELVDRFREQLPNMQQARDGVLGPTWEQWLESEYHAINRQLAAEQAKVALADAALRNICRVTDSMSCSEHCPGCTIAVLAVDALAALQSSDALADIRREVARECAEICDDTEIEWMGGPYNRAENARQTLRSARDAIRAKFGVTE